MAVVTAAVVLTACGSDGGDKAASGGKTAPDAKKTADAGAHGGEVRRKVTLEVRGKGALSQVIYYQLSSNGYESGSLPWKKTETLTLTSAQQKVGVLVSVVPGSVAGPDGTLKPGACVITVDGKEVADNQGGTSDTSCEYRVR
ncbi:hypothetical protein ABZ686_03885 [Streptomyces sp. NPDC006992]|uniref:hypothetical protein n=1 Tax=unclassified Streptomyces TaxID=2593676 RepID=UPI0033F436C0